MSTTHKITLDRDRIDACRDLATAAIRPVLKYIQLHSTVSIERATLRLLGVPDIARDGGQRDLPLVNQIVDRLDEHRLAMGISFWIGLAKVANPDSTLTDIAHKIAAGEIDLNTLPEAPTDKIRQTLAEEGRAALQELENTRRNRERQRTLRPWEKTPLKQLAVGSGNVYEDIVQMRQAAYAGADTIGVTRASAQSLLDYVPSGPTVDGYGGTYATAANIQLVRNAVDDIGKETRRYVRLAYNGSGLCLPELSAIAGKEGVDILFSDGLYAILFRDINMKRAFVDQHASRLLLGKTSMFVHTGESHFFGAMDAFDACPQALTAQFLNEAFALAAGLREDKVGLSHTFVMDPTQEDSLLFEIAMAELIRELFPKSPIHYLPPTRHKTGDIFEAHTLDAFFALIGSFTKQSSIELGLLSGGTRKLAGDGPMQDRYTALKSANYILNATRSLHPDLVLRQNGVIMRRARTILEQATRHLTKIKDLGLMVAFEKGMFGNTIRNRNEGKGVEGIFQKARLYFNPVFDPLERRNVAV